MVPIATRRLTPVGFRRDIKFFLACLVGFLVFIILTLLVLLQTVTQRATERTLEQWRFASDVATAALNRLPESANRSEIESQLIFLRGQYDITTIALAIPGETPLVSGFPAADSGVSDVKRNTQHGEVTFSFDPAELVAARKTFLYTAGISIAATILGTILLSLYLPRIVRPIEEMLDDASVLGERAAGVDEANYLIDTFRNSIQTLREQEVELKRLHELEKTRADDLQRITATLTRSLTSGFIATDRDGRVIDMNAAAREILRLPERQDSAGLTVPEALGDTPFSAELQRAIDSGVPMSRQEIKHPDGNESVTIGLSTVPLTDEDSRPLGVIALFADLTPVRLLESRVREMQTLADLGEISAGIAHEFRNSLSTILGYLKLAGRDPLPDETRKRLGHAEEEATLLSEAVEGLLSFARPMQMEMRPTQLAPLVRGIVERFEDQYEGVAIEAKLADVTIAADAVLVSRAVENLIRNAIDAVRQKGSGTITITLSDDPAPQLTIADTGIGFEPEAAARLMLPFQSDKPDGMGLGLPLARKIVMLHGGSLQLTGAPGEGASVVIEFPAG